MTAAVSADSKAMTAKSPESQLSAFMARYTPEIVALARGALKKMRTRLPGAIQLVYDNYNALVIGFGPTDRASDAIFSIVLYPRWVTLFFLNGVNLPDPTKILKGSGKRVRHIVLDDAATLDKAEVRALMARALKQEGDSLKHGRAGRIVIKSISAKQRPRRPAAGKHRESE